MVEDNNQAEVFPDISAESKDVLRRAPYFLQSRNVLVNGRRTSVRLEAEMWSALTEIAVKERSSVHDLCSAVYKSKNSAATFTAALRVFLVQYFRRNANGKSKK